MRPMELSPDEEQILEVVESPEAVLDPERRGGDETSETLARLYTELLGLLPYELPPVQPRPEVRQRILAAIPTGQARVFLPTYGAEARGTVLTWPEDRAPGRAPRRSGETVAPAGASASRGPLALAAALFLLLLGAGGAFYTVWSKQSREIEGLRERVAALAARGERVGPRESAVAEARLQQMAQQLAVVTSPEVAYCALVPTAESGLGEGVRGRMFVQADHQHWYLAVHGLKPAEAGKHYRLWFVDDKGQPFPAGTLEARDDRPAELASATMPAGTRQAVVTLEADPQAPRPTGPAVLKAMPMQTL